MLVTTRVLWLLGAAWSWLIAYALPVQQKPYLWQVCLFLAVLTALTQSLRWAVVYVVQGDEPELDRRARYVRWAGRAVLVAVFAWLVRTQGFSNLAPPASPQPQADEFAQFGGHEIK